MRMLASAIALAIAGPASAQSLAIVQAEAWTMESDTPVPDATILVDGRRIVSVTPGGDVPAGVRTIDARGKHVPPRFVNGATQIGLAESSGSAGSVDTASRDQDNPGPDVHRALTRNSASEIGSTSWRTRGGKSVYV